MSGTVHGVCTVLFRYLHVGLSASFKLLQYFWNGWSYALHTCIWQMGRPHCQTQQTWPYAPLSGTTNLALCPTVRHSKPHPVPHCQAQQTWPCAHCQTQQTSTCAHCQTQQTSPCAHCQMQQTSPCTALSDTANLALCPTIRHSKPRPVPHYQTQQTSHCAHCQTQQTSPCAPLSDTENIALCPLSDTANLALCPTVRHSKPRIVPTVRHSKPRHVPHCQTQQTSPCAPLSDTPCAALSVVMLEFIRMMLYSSTAWQVCHASHYLLLIIHSVLHSVVNCRRS